MATTSTEVTTPRRGRPPRVSADDIISAALDLFARRGYRGTTLAAIAGAVGVTDAALLRHFESKAAILEAVLARDDERANRQFVENIEPGGLEALRRLAGSGWHMEEGELTTRMQIVLTAEALSEGSELHGRFVERNRYVRRTIARVIRQGIKAGDIRTDIDPVYEATVLVAFIEGLRVQWFLADGDVPLDSYIRSFVEQLIERIAATSA